MANELPRLAVPVGEIEVQAEEGQMAGFCIECERLWKEYSAAMREYLGLNRPANSAVAFHDWGVGPLSMIGPEPESQPALAAMKARILEHENAAHSEATEPAGPRS